MIKRKIPLLSLQKMFPNELDTQWVSTNKEKSNNLNKEFLNQFEILDKKSLSLDILVTRTRFCNDDTKKECVPKMYDPFLNELYRGTIKRGVSSSIINNTLLENWEKRVRLNRIHTIFLPNIDYQEFEQKAYTIDKKPLSTEIDEFLTLINELGNEAKSSLNLKGLSLFSNQEQRRAN
uniref:Protein TIC 214 n=1 Tax=Solanum lycopersicum TaxID=4081 RepID=A0A3Q7JKY9_SOLLC